MDPPRWILGSQFTSGLSLSTKYSIEEIRLFYYTAYAEGLPSIANFFTAWNSAVVSAYDALVQEIAKISIDANVLEGLDGRTLDIRDPNSFPFIITPLPIEPVMEEIRQNYNPSQIFPRHQNPTQPILPLHAKPLLYSQNLPYASAPGSTLYSPNAPNTTGMPPDANAHFQNTARYRAHSTVNNSQLPYTQTTTQSACEQSEYEIGKIPTHPPG